MSTTEHTNPHAERPLVLEVTEHEVIEDYDVVREAIRELGNDIRVAVDDAGAGVANFGHIIDLRPDFVKLDFSLVRRVNANLGRQALVVGMRHFARTAGCRLIAEGVRDDRGSSDPHGARCRVRAGLPLWTARTGRDVGGSKGVMVAPVLAAPSDDQFSVAAAPEGRVLPDYPSGGLR